MAALLCLRQNRARSRISVPGILDDHVCAVIEAYDSAALERPSSNSPGMVLG